MEYNIQKIREIQHILSEKIDLRFKRFIYEKIDFRQRLIGIIGPRGVGKTTLILQYLKESHTDSDDVLYFLADNILFSKGDLFDLAREFYLKHGGRLMCIDEIHRYPDWNQELKNIYDSFPELKIIFSGSSSLNLTRGAYDLSRRGVIYEMPGLSFREYLLFARDIESRPLDLDAIFRDYRKESKRLAGEQRLLKYFNNYLAEGYYPFFRETGNRILYWQQINNVIDKTIHEDIASFYRLKTQNLIIFKKILNFLATISPGEININKLARNLGKNYATVSEYLQILQESRLVRFLPRGRSGHALVRKAEKIYMDNADLNLAINHNLGRTANIGGIRELFILNQLQNAGYIPCHTAAGDIRINNKTIEVGGRNKNFSQLTPGSNSYLALDDILIADKGKIPLYIFGFLY